MLLLMSRTHMRQSSGRQRGWRKVRRDGSLLVCRKIVMTGIMRHVKRFEEVIQTLGGVAKTVH
jgi:hypothetical protein